jgi:hypothetical protein
MKFKKSISILVLGMIVVACSTNPFTGKQTLALGSKFADFTNGFSAIQ